MEPLIALVGTTGAARLVGHLRSHPVAWGTALRCGVAAMFTLTGVAHFVGMREELVEMVPPALPEPQLLVTITGVLELAGAVGVLLPATAESAAGSLTVLLVAMFPANVHHAVSAPDVRWDDQLLPRTLMQVVFVGATTAVVVRRRRARRVGTKGADTPFVDNARSVRTTMR